MNVNDRESHKGLVAIIDDDLEILDSVAMLLEVEGYQCKTFPSASAFMESEDSKIAVRKVPFCILSDVMMPGIDGLAFQKHLNDIGSFHLILMSGAAGARDVAQAFRSGAVDFLTKPFEDTELLRVIDKALSASKFDLESRQREGDLQSRIQQLTKRELEVARLVSTGETNQAIADKLSIVLRTVKLHRQRAMDKLGCRRVVDLARLLDESAQSAKLSSLKEEARKWEVAALQDVLTGALNRMGFEQLIKPKVPVESPLAVAVLDVDFFKRVNDTFGHATGDRVLKAVVSLILQHTRHDLLARVGGEEFVLVLPKTSAYDALVVCKRICQAIENHRWASIHDDLKVTISIGLANRKHEATLEELIEGADKALYRAKSEGRNRVCVQ